MTLPVRQESSSPVRWDPWREFESLTGQMNQLFESAFGQSGLATGGGWAGQRPSNEYVEEVRGN